MLLHEIEQNTPKLPKRKSIGINLASLKIGRADGLIRTAYFSPRLHRHIRYRILYTHSIPSYPRRIINNLAMYKDKRTAPLIYYKKRRDINGFIKDL